MERKENPLKKFKPLKIENSKGDMDVEIMLKKFAKAVERDGKLQILRSKEYYEKPSEKNRKRYSQFRIRINKENSERGRGII